jgi:uncharacterized membrane protein YobD (UPF0266 family)
MEEAIYTALPNKDYTTLIMLSILLLISGILLYLVQTKKILQTAGNYRSIAFLLGGFATLILFVSTLLTAWNLYSIQSVRLYDTYMESYHGKTDYLDIARAGIFNDKNRSLVNPQIVIREDNILVVEKRDKRVMLFAEDHYDLKKLVQLINTQMEKAVIKNQ